MIRPLFRYTLSFALLFIVVYYTQGLIIDQLELILNYDPVYTNLFFCLASLVINIHFLFLSKIESIRPQLGFIFLPTLFIKGGLFYIVFKSSISNLENYSIAERLNLLIPFLIFLALEVFFIAKILNKKTP